MIAAAESAGLMRWMENALREAAELGRQRPDLKLHDPHKLEMFLLEQMHQQLLHHDHDEYQMPDPPPHPLVAVDWEKHIDELAYREGAWGLHNPKLDAVVRRKLRLTQKLHRRRNGSMRRGQLQTERSDRSEWCHVCILGRGVVGPLRYDGRHRACEDHAIGGAKWREK
jgi:hypothetical protein